MQRKTSSIVVMRHAETVYNAPRKRLQGQSPDRSITLSDKGRNDVRRHLSQIPLPDILITSPLLRAKQTAEVWAGKSYFQMDCKKYINIGLSEVDVGDLEGLYVDELPHHPKLKEIWDAWKNNPQNFTGFPNGENLLQLQKRVLETLSLICNTYGSDPALDICIITHGGPLRILNCFLANNDLSHFWDGSEVTNLSRVELTEKQIIELQKYQSNITDLMHLRSKSSMFRLNQQQDSAPEYFNYEYPASHWANHLPTNEDNDFIAALEINGVKIAFKVNPTDARGYRSIVALLPEDGKAMSSTFNRSYSTEEEVALSIGLTILALAYKKFGMAAQTSVAGNNAQSVTASGKVLYGNEKEPHLLHGHVIGRGNPPTCYISNVTLKGPKAGLEMNLRGDGSDEGNTSKEKWNPQDMKDVAAALASEVKNILVNTQSLQNIKILALSKAMQFDKQVASSSLKLT